VTRDAMSFLALSVIPELKLSDLGLIDTVRFEVTPVSAGPAGGGSA